MTEPKLTLSQVWAKIPDIECKGLCAESCGPIAMSDRERTLLRFRGATIPDPVEAMTQLAFTGKYSCPALVDDRCSVYSVRPSICRLWGVVEGMPCEWGCVPKDGHLSDDEAGLILRLADGG